MNETLKVMETRRSCRNFDKKKMVSAEELTFHFCSFQIDI